jgi:hypothetical protein
MDLVPDTLLLRKSGSSGNLNRISGSVARNSDHQTTEAVSAEVRAFNLIVCFSSGNEVKKEQTQKRWL